MQLLAFTCGWLTPAARLRDAGARVVFGHDAEAWASVPAEMD